MVKSAFTTHFTGIFQQFIPGQTKELPPWIINPPPDPRSSGMGVLECVWSPGFNTITLRSEEELSAMSHYCFKGKGKDGRVREESIKLIIHSGAAESVPDVGSTPARREEERRRLQRLQEIKNGTGGGLIKHGLIKHGSHEVSHYTMTLSAFFQKGGKCRRGRCEQTSRMAVQ
jgi:hypothetical protein